MRPGSLLTGLARALRAPLSIGPRAGFALLLGVGLLVVLHDLGGRSLHRMDSPRWGQLAREVLQTGEWIVPRHDEGLYANKPPLYLWSIALPARLAGDVTALHVRLPSALGFLALVAATVWWGRLRSGSDRVGLLAGWIALTTFGPEWLAREGRPDMLGAALSVWGAALLDRAALGRGRPRDPWLAGGLLGLALLVKGPPHLLLPLAVLLAPGPEGALRERLRRARPLGVLGTAVGVALLWFVPAALEGGEEYVRRLLFQQMGERVAGRGNHIESPAFFLGTLGVVWLPWGPLLLGALAALAVPRWRRRLGPAQPLLAAAAAVLVIHSLVPTKDHRYLAPLLPPLSLAAAVWLDPLLPRLASRRAYAALAAAALVGAAGLVLAGTFARGSLLDLLVPAVGLLVAGACAWRARADLGVAVAPSPAPSAAPSAAGVGLVALAFALLGVLVLRPRFGTNPRDEFAAHLRPHSAGVAVVALAPVAPEDLFYGAPEARAAADPGCIRALVGAAPHLVVCREQDLAAVVAAEGHDPVLRLPPEGGDRWLAAWFP